MQELFEKLENILKSELDIHHVFLKTAQEFNSAIREENLGDVDRQRTIQDETICRIEKLEDERKLCCGDLASRFGITKKQVKLTMLLVKMPEAWRMRIEQVHKALKEKVAELVKISVSNRILLEEGLKVATHTFSAIQQCGNRFAGYGQSGKPATGSALRSIINRTV